MLIQLRSPTGPSWPAVHCIMVAHRASAKSSSAECSCCATDFVSFNVTPFPTTGLLVASRNLHLISWIFMYNIEEHYNWANWDMLSVRINVLLQTQYGDSSRLFCVRFRKIAFHISLRTPKYLPNKEKFPVSILASGGVIMKTKLISTKWSPGIKARWMGNGIY